eukprot:COSAG05_NODE_2262_length_3318_cov_4.455421_2_plen_475_part_00
MRAEHTIDKLTVVAGSIPAGLSGSFVRTGPNPRFPEKYDPRSYHFFVGDAMVHGVELGGGRATYRNRWVQTRGYRSALATGGDSVGQPVPAEFGKGNSGGNTAMLFHAGRLLALSEGTQGAWQLELPSLATAGFFTFGDQLKHNFTAHPKVCAESGELHLFGYGANEVEPEHDAAAHIHYSAVSKDGVFQYKDVPVPFRKLIMAHDMALSRDHVVFFDMPLWDMAAPVKPEDGTRFGVLPRGAPAEAIKWFEASGCYGYHTANAWDEQGADGGACLELIYCSSQRFHFQRSNADSLFLHRWRFDLSSGQVLADEDVCPIACEFPIVNPAVVGLRTRYIWANALVSEPSPLSSNAIFKFDVQTREWLMHELEGNRRASESFFVPRHGGSGAEDDNNNNNEYVLFQSLWNYTLPGSPNVLTSSTDQGAVTGHYKDLCYSILPTIYPLTPAEVMPRSLGPRSRRRHGLSPVAPPLPR